MTSALYKAVCSPFANQLGKRDRMLVGIDGRHLTLTIETTPAEHRPALEVTLRKQLV